MPSSTSSFRISDELEVQLEHAAARLNKGKNWIINQALKEYLERHSFEALRAEARRQSMLASKKPFEGEKAWENAGLETWDEEYRCLSCFVRPYWTRSLSNRDTCIRGHRPA